MNSKQIKALREHIGREQGKPLSQESFGLMFGRSRQTINRWENGSQPTDELVQNALVELGKRYGFDIHSQG